MRPVFVWAARQIHWDTLRLVMDPKRIELVTCRVGEERLDEVPALNARFAALVLAQTEAAPPGGPLIPRAVAVQIDGGGYQSQELPPGKTKAPGATASPELPGRDLRHDQPGRAR